MKTTIKALALSIAGFAATAANAADLEITLQNLTSHNHFTPVLAAAHNMDNYIFKVGRGASDELEAQAEGGMIADLSAKVSMMGAQVVENPAGGLLAPGASTTFMLDSMDYGYLSLSSMILPTNDGIVGLDSWMIPSEAGTYTIDLLAYDAGTELNNELIVDGSGAVDVDGIPADPSGMSGTGGMGVMVMSENPYVHVHPGILGDTDNLAGYSDLDSRYHRWLNPIARLTVVVK